MTIRILDQATVNKIAAGEVVERPASVVKELVENAIDSGAASIKIEISSNGEIKTIRVTDDGKGMSHKDALLAFTPHATSKIVTIDDLHRIRTLGFRGEALATIAAVARVILVTKMEGESSGTKVVVEGGKIQEHSITGAPVGTSIMVENLFFNTPARKKFQKSRNTELAHTHAIMEGICLSHPEISFRFYHNRSEQLVTDRTTDILETIARIYGGDVARDLIPVSSEMPFMTISGYVSYPARTRKDSARMLIAINQRYVSSTLINNAIREGYGTLLPKDRFPVTFLRLEIDTELVDVNVHPTKKVVRLTKEKEIGEAVQKAVNTALLSHDLIPAVDGEAGSSESLSLIAECSPAAQYVHTRSLAAGETLHARTSFTDQRLRQTELATGTVPVQSRLPDFDVIGEFGGIYIIAWTDAGELVIIDQHAAHERILYEQVTGRLLSEHRSQELIAPVVLERSPKDAAIIREILPDLAEEGFLLEEFGRNTFLVRAIPVVLGRMEEARIIDEVISDLVGSDPARSVSTRERITRIIACRGAIKAGTVCTREQCQRIVDQLRLTNNPFTCPHGRPTMIRFSRAELDAMFKRT
jgi:DNA mismatch repair protein MutL